MPELIVKGKKRKYDYTKEGKAAYNKAKTAGTTRRNKNTTTNKKSSRRR